jgi:hypothetical protein
MLYGTPKSEDFCIWRPFCILVTMATVAILIFFNPPPKKAATYYGGYFYKVDHNSRRGHKIREKFNVLGIG